CISLSLLFYFFFFSMLLPPPISSLFPYTTLFRSHGIFSSFLGMHCAPSLAAARSSSRSRRGRAQIRCGHRRGGPDWSTRRRRIRSEEHTSELQSLAYLVCRLLLEKKKKKKTKKHK